MEEGKEFWKQNIIEAVNEIENETYLMKIFYFMLVFLD